MRFLRTQIIHLSLAAALLQGALHAFEPEIKLTGRKDLVLGIETRETVLEIGARYLTKKTDDYASKIEDLTPPFSFERESSASSVANNNQTEEPPEPEPVVYDDAAVLKAAAVSFSKKVRGSIARGATNYLQLEGGVLLKPGTSFPVRLPQAKDQTFELTVTEISSEGYTLKIGEATQQLSFNSKSQSNSVQFSNP